MLIEEVRSRLAVLPSPLPEPPVSLQPQAFGPPGGTPPWRRGRVEAGRNAAVLLLLYPDATGEAHLVLTERPTGNLRHSGQVSFPGGAVEPGDDYPAGTALREAAEEVALDAVAAGVETFGVLETVDMRRVSGFVVAPVLAVASREPVLVPDQREVASILRVPVSTFLPDAMIEIVEAEREDGWRMRYGAYPFGEYRIWGMTAGILGQLGAVLAASRSTGSSTRM
jgi:8-oxo-dGTP pyrophosphatase MutT (NUDIX family)